MITNDEAQIFIKVLKRLVSDTNVKFPDKGKKILLEALDSKENRFILDVQRGRANPQKCTFQTRVNGSVVLLRVDIAGPPHPNPDGEEIPCPHIHIYQEGYATRWAYPLDEYIQTDEKDLIQVFLDFLVYNNVSNRTEITIQGGVLFSDTN